MSDERVVLSQVRAFLAKAKSSAGGWVPTIHDSSALEEKQVYLYVADYPSGWVWLVTLPLSTYVSCSLRAAKETPAVVEGSRAACSVLISRAADRNPMATIANVSWTDQLAAALAFYSGTTRVWQLADRFCRGGHFVVIHYREPGASHGKLRPFAFPGNDDCPVPYDVLLGAVGDVMRQDFNAHPDWTQHG